MYKCLKKIQKPVLNKYFQGLQHMHTIPSNVFKISEEVADSLIRKKPVVALESTVITHGLPYPNNLECALKLEEIVRENNAVPATIGILNGVINVGMDPGKIGLLANSKKAVKVSRRDLPYVISQKLDGGTTVAGTMILAHRAGISVFATGGIGGVHRGAETTMDISADLMELSRTPLTVVSAGVKSILDIKLTLEYLETVGVCLATFGTSKMFPSFYTAFSECYSPVNVENAVEAAHLIYSRDILQLDSGILLAVPIPQTYRADGEKAHSVIETALKEARKKGVVGKDITPFVLDQVRLLSEGASLRANIGLLENNTKIASQVAAELSKLRVAEGSTSPRTMLAPVRHEASNTIQDSRPVVIGGSILDIHVKALEDIKMDGRTVTGKVHCIAGGVARNIADCMTRLGANPFFVSNLGAQEYADTLLSKMDHVDKRGIRIVSTARTATCVVVLDLDGESIFIVGDMSVHDQLTPEQVEAHGDMIANAPMVVMDSNAPVQTIIKIMNLCAKHQVPIWFEPTDISIAWKPFESSAWRSSLAYASPNLNELRVMHDKVFNKVTPPLQDLCLENKIEESIRLGVPLLNDALHTLVVTLSSHGILLITKIPENAPFPTNSSIPNVDKVRAVHYPAPKPGEIISVSGAGDCFASAMIAAILRGLDPESCIAAGQRAATLCLASHLSVPESISANAVFDQRTVQSKHVVATH